MVKEEQGMEKVVFVIDDTFPDDPEYYRRRKKPIPKWLQQKLKKEKEKSKKKE